MNTTKHESKECKNCGKMFIPRHGNQVYCIECKPITVKRANCRAFHKYYQNESNRQKHLVRLSTNYLMRKHILQRQCCEMCGSDVNIQAHHPYYKKSLKRAVIWLCHDCHVKLHYSMQEVQ